MLQDPISDMLTRIRNAAMVRKSDVVLPYSKVKMAIAEILKSEGYVEDVKLIEKGKDVSFDQIRLKLKYSGRKAAISHIKRISKPSLRIYRKKDEMPVVLNNLGIAIVSTTKGLMTNKQAKKEGVGGEIICEIY